MITLNTYKATLQHDNGKFKLMVKASSEAAAKDIICKAEGCPDRAIIKIELIQTKVIN